MEGEGDGVERADVGVVVGSVPSEEAVFADGACGGFGGGLPEWLLAVFGQVGEGAVSEHVLEAAAGAAHVAVVGDDDFHVPGFEVGQQLMAGDCESMATLAVRGQWSGDVVDRPLGAFGLGGLEAAQFDVRGAVPVVDGAADGQRAAVGFHVERVADQSFDVWVCRWRLWPIVRG